MSADFALELPELTEGNVYVITDHATFSAGIYSSFYPEAADRRRTFIVGERVGDASRFWAETGAPFALPSGIGIGYALQLHDVGNGCQAPECHMLRHANPRWNIAVGSLEPEIPAPLTYAAYAAGRDPALEAILEHFDGATPASGGP